MNKQTPAAIIKSRGFKSLKEVSRLSGRCEKTIYNLYQNDRDFFNLILDGLEFRKQT